MRRRARDFGEALGLKLAVLACVSFSTACRDIWSQNITSPTLILVRCVVRRGRTKPKEAFHLPFCQGATYSSTIESNKLYFYPVSFFNLHDLNRDGILDHDELAAIYGVHHETSRQHTPDAEKHRQKTEEILGQVLKAVDFNKDGVVTKSEFLVAAKKGGLPNFEGMKGLGHHYDEGALVLCALC